MTMNLLMKAIKIIHHKYINILIVTSQNLYKYFYNGHSNHFKAHIIFNFKLVYFYTIFAIITTELSFIVKL